MGSTNENTDDLTVPVELLQQLRESLPEGSYVRCIEYLRQNDYGSVLLIIETEIAEADMAWQAARSNPDRNSWSMRKSKRYTKRLRTATDHFICVVDAGILLMKYLVEAKIYDPFVYDIIRLVRPD